MIKIDSLQNPIIKETQSLLNKKGRTEYGAFIVEGFKQFKEIPANFKIKYVLISDAFAGAEIKAHKVYKVSDKIFAKISETDTPQGIIAVVEKPNYNIDEIIKREGLYVILDNVQDPGNVGTILRSAWAFGAECVFVSAGSADVYSGKVVRASMGAVFNIAVITDCNTLEIIEKLKAAEIKVCALSLKAQKNCYDEKLKNVAFIIGNEGAGLGADVEKVSDVLLKIPVKSSADSLNAATAAGIILYEHSRQNKK
jgi:TrmH family RNA methyltransferase